QLLLKEALFLEGEKAYCAQVLLTVDTPGSLSCQFYGRPADGERDAGWTLHATGRIRLHSANVETPPVDIPAGLPTEEGAPGGSHYGAMQRRGLEYGPAFQSVQQWWRQEQSVQAALRLPAAVAGEAAGYQLHPALLDGCFQLLVAL